MRSNGNYIKRFKVKNKSMQLNFLKDSSQLKLHAVRIFVALTFTRWRYQVVCLTFSILQVIGSFSPLSNHRHDINVIVTSQY